jgi:hypothetical protein
MIKLKKGVDLHILSPQAVLGMSIVDGVYGEFLEKECWITSVADGKHSRKSLHRLGMAFDVRLPSGVVSMYKTVVSAAKEALGEDFDVVLEEDHIHVEWDPKGGIVE